MRDLVLTEEQELLQRTAAGLAREHAPVERVRRLRAAGDAAFHRDRFARLMGF